MKGSSLKAALAASVALVTGPVEAWAAAQASPNAEQNSTDQDPALEEIIVTAQRRGENLQDVPIAISAVTSETTRALNIQTAQDVTQLVPGFTFQRQAGGAAPFIRGVGSTSSFIGNEPSVAIFTDDVYVNNGNVATFEFNNIDVVEILKGPQGTLFGRNATGGVVHIRTRNPSFTPTADIALSYGSYDTINAQAYASMPLNDNAAINMSVFRLYQGEGWGENINDGRDSYTNESWGIRSKLLVNAGENTEILLSGTYSNRISDQGMALRVVSGYFGFAGSNADALGAGFWDTASSAGVNNFYDTSYWMASGKITHDLGSVKLVSITAYSKTTSNFRFDLDVAPANILNATVLNAGKTFTQELQLLSGNDSSFKWIIGGFFLKDDALFDLTADGLAFSRFGAGAVQTQFSQQKTTSYAGFGQATYEILPKLNLTAGLRYTSDRRRESEGGSQIISAAGTVLSNAGPFGSTTTFKKLTGRAAIDYHVNDDILVYTSFNRGFKSGVYNLPGYSPASTGPLPPVKPEVVDAYAAGFKSELFDRTVRLNMEAFYYNFSNIQFQNNVPPPNAGTILSNAGKARIKGVEAELQIVPTDGLTILTNVSLLDGEYTSFPSGPVFFPLAPNSQIPIPAGCAFTAYPTGSPGATTAQRNCDLSGSKTVNTPPFAASVSVIYNVPTAIGGLTFAASYAHGGNYFSEPHNLEFVRQTTTNIVNASIKWTDRNDKIDVRLWANNLTGEKYYSYVANGGTSGPKYSPAAPRTYGITLGAHF